MLPATNIQKITAKNILIMNKNLEIHGLRGLSIIAVLLYHLNPNLFTGGYLGVDIFFVISGFLISKMIFSKKRIVIIFFYDWLKILISAVQMDNYMEM